MWWITLKNPGHWSKNSPASVRTSSSLIRSAFQTVAVNALVVAAQRGGKVYATLPPFGPETLPTGVVREFASWPDIFEEDQTDLEKWTYETYFPEALTAGRLVPHPVEKISGGLGKGVNDALDKLLSGVSGVKLVIDPWK